MKTYRIKYQVEGGGLQAPIAGSGFYRGKRDNVVRAILDRWQGHSITILKAQRWSPPILGGDERGKGKGQGVPEANPQPTRRRPWKALA